jgi:hypothetical protein
MAATVMALLLQAPPAIASLNPEGKPLQIWVVPVIAGGNGFTVTATPAMQPVARV